MKFLRFILLFGISFIFSKNYENISQLFVNQNNISANLQNDLKIQNIDFIILDEDDEIYEARADFISFENNESIYYGKIKVEISDSETNKVEFEIENLSENQSYYARFNNQFEYYFNTDEEGEFEIELSSEDSGNEFLPEELTPVSDLISVSLFSQEHYLIESAFFLLEDDACANLTIELCTEIPMCVWDEVLGCTDDDWDFDDDNDGIPDDEDDDDDNDGIPDNEDDDDWDEGDYFSEDLYDIYEDYIEDYNINGTGLFNFIIVNFDRSGRNDIGDNIGLFDSAGQLNSLNCEPSFGNLVVGSGVLNENSTVLFAFGMRDECAEGGNLYPGFVEGNQINLEFWNSNDSTLTILPIDANFGPNQSIIEITVSLPEIDLNDDLIFNVVDIIIMVNMVLGTENINNDADVNLDGFINVTDIILAIGMILSN